MRIIIKPLGAVLILGALVSTGVLALRPTVGNRNVPEGAAVAGTSFGTTASQPAPETVLYDGELRNGWENYGWAKVLDWKDTTRVLTGNSAAIRAEPGPFEAIYMHHAAFIPAGYDRISYALNGGDRGGQSVKAVMVIADHRSTYDRTLPPLKAGQWQRFTLHLKDYGVVGKQKINGFWLMNANSTKAPAFYVDAVHFLRPGEPDPAGN